MSPKSGFLIQLLDMRALLSSFPIGHKTTKSATRRKKNLSNVRIKKKKKSLRLKKNFSNVRIKKKKKSLRFPNKFLPFFHIYTSLVSHKHKKERNFSLFCFVDFEKNNRYSNVLFPFKSKVQSLLYNFPFDLLK